MEIIADMGNFRKMVSVSDTELAMILGHDNEYSATFSKDAVKVGRHIDIVAFKKVSGYIRNMNTLQLKDILSRLASTQVELEKAINLGDELQVFDKLKDA